MERFVEQTIRINNDLSLRFIQTDLVSNLFINNHEKNLLTKSAELMTFKGLLSILAFYSEESHYTIGDDGIILYTGVITLNEDLYIQLEDTIDYEDTLSHTLHGTTDDMQVGLYYLSNDASIPDLEIAAYDLDTKIIELFHEIDDFQQYKDMYKAKLLSGLPSHSPDDHISLDINH